VNHPVKRFTLTQELDEQGRLEEFCSDAGYILKRETTRHLQDNGLPKIGTYVQPGICLIAKFGATSSYSKSRMPSEMESLASDEDELIERYGHMFYDGSLYVPDGVFGVVTNADFSLNEAGRKLAIVEIECKPLA